MTTKYERKPAARTSRISGYGTQRTKDEPVKNIWSSMLDSVATGKRLPEKNILVFGGTPETQKEFLETIGSENSKPGHDRHRRKSPIANEFALGYTYQDVLDTDHEDTLARLSIYLLAEPSPAFAPIVKPLFSARNVPETLAVILLDWTEPWNWVRQLRDWILFFRGVTSGVNDDTRERMTEVMSDWKQRRRGGLSYDGGGGGPNKELQVAIPLGQGEWDEELGIPLCVVCHSVDKIEKLEQEQGWREEEFDFVLQFLRTILLKHGASLVYISPSVPNSLPTLIHSSLGIHSLLKRQPLKHDVINREKILIPPNWDSWGKIRVLRDGFDVERISSGWSIDIQATPSSLNNDGTNFGTTHNVDQKALPNEQSNEGASLPSYEEIIKDPRKDTTIPTSTSTLHLEVETLPTQTFLSQQLATMDRLKAEEAAEESQKHAPRPTPTSFTNADDVNSIVEDSGRVNEHIGPVQFNMGGIQVDADDMLKRLKDREAVRTEGKVEDGKAQNEALASFFAGLMKKGTGSPRSTLGHA